MSNTTDQHKPNEQQHARRTLRSIQCGRGIAALMVVIYHTSVIFRIPTYWGALPFGEFPRFLDSGVDFFFVLSGFIILDAHARDLGSYEALRRFAWRRFARIYPMYWVIFGVVLLPFLMINPGTGVGRMVLEFLLLPADFGVPDQKILTVSWTLCYEVAFYAVFGLAILNVRLGTVLALLWTIGSISSLAQSDPDKWTILSSPFTLLFFLGMGVRQFWSSGKFTAPLVPTFVLGAAIFAVAAVNRVSPFGMSSGVGHWLYGIGASMMLLVAIEAECRNSLSFPEFLKKLGDASYSLYLVHFVTLSVVAKLISKTRLFESLPLQVIFVVMICSAVVVGIAVHRFVEKPILSQLMTLTRRHPFRRAAAQPSTNG